ncbi:hypothetical protein [Streptomyces sp. bgisy031]|uniref:hypothetical protein n=1 Tax=Streptomyces sp. bgisy031 TaxID=3413772 RepID=UPI003D71C03A
MTCTGGESFHFNVYPNIELPFRAMPFTVSPGAPQRYVRGTQRAAGRGPLRLLGLRRRRLPAPLTGTAETPAEVSVATRYGDGLPSVLLTLSNLGGTALHSTSSPPIPAGPRTPCKSRRAAASICPGRPPTAATT